MITNCPVCGKGFDILWPHLWRYKRGNSYLCSWKCLRLTDKNSERKKEEEVYKKPAKRVRMKPDDMETALNLFRSGDSSLDQFLKDHGITHVAKWKANAKARHPEQVATVKVDGPLRIETPERNNVKVVEVPEKPAKKPIEYKVTGIQTEVGEFWVVREGKIKWVPGRLAKEDPVMQVMWPEAEPALVPEMWRRFAEIILYVIDLLEVES